VMMGRKSFTSLGKALPGRKNIVWTRNPDWHAHDVMVAHTFEEGLEWAATTDAAELFVIGGAQLFAAAMPEASRIYRTVIHHAFEGDTWFPEMEKNDWNLRSARHFDADARNPWPHTFEIWERRS
jgi:dihydrofolate reductase